MVADTSVPLARWQQGEQAVAVVAIDFHYSLGSMRELTSPVSLMLNRWVQLMSPLVLGRAHPMPVWMLSIASL